MANQLFQNFPEIQYTLNTGKIVTIKDFFRKSTIEKSAVNSIIDYTYYELQDGERPDVVASKLYGDGDLHWTFFLVNELENYYDWHMDTETFEAYLNDRFKGQTLFASQPSQLITEAANIVGFEIGEKITDSTGLKIGRVTRVNPTYKSITVDGHKFAPADVVTGSASTKAFTVHSVADHRDSTSYYVNADKIKRNYQDAGNPPVYSAVSHYTEAWDVNEAKRKIKIIRPEKIKRVVSEFERVMSNG